MSYGIRLIWDLIKSGQLLIEQRSCGLESPILSIDVTLKGIDELNGVPGTIVIYPLDELYSIDLYTKMVLENKEKHEAIGMIIYREAIV